MSETTEKAATVSDQEIIKGILEDVNDIQSVVGMCGLDDAARMLTRIRRSAVQLANMDKKKELTQEQILAGYRAEAVRMLVMLEFAVNYTGLEKITEDNLHKVMLTAEMFIQRTHTYFEKKACTVGLIDDSN